MMSPQSGDTQRFGEATARALRENVRALEERRAAHEARLPRAEQVARTITRFTGSMTFVYLHLIAYGLWVIVNLGWLPGLTQFDPTLVILATEASVEALFLSTFVLISQNRMAAEADRRAELDLHVNLLTEHELTKLAGLMSAMAERMDLPGRDDPQLEEVRREVGPLDVLDELDRHRPDPSRR